MDRGGQPGNKNATKNKPWRDAIDWALKNHKNSKVEQAQALRDIATKLIDEALEGDLTAMKELGDRVDGKATTHVELETKEPISLVMNYGKGES